VHLQHLRNIIDTHFMGAARSIVDSIAGIGSNLFSSLGGLTQTINISTIQLGTQIAQELRHLAETLDTNMVNMTNCTRVGIENLVTTISGGAESIASSLKSVGEAISTRISVGVGEIRTPLEEMRDILRGISIGIGNVGTTISTGVDVVGNIAGSINNISNTINNIATGLINAVFKQAREATDTIINTTAMVVGGAAKLVGLLDYATLGRVMYNVIQAILDVSSEIFTAPLLTLLGYMSNEIGNEMMGRGRSPGWAQVLGKILSYIGGMFGRLQELAFSYYTGEMAEDARVRRDLNIGLSFLPYIAKFLFIYLNLIVETAGRFKIIGTRLGLPYHTIIEMSRGIERLIQNALGFPWLLTEFWRRLAKEFIAEPLAAHYRQLWRTRSLTIPQVLKLTAMRIFNEDFGREILLAKGYKDWKADSLIIGAYKYPTMEMTQRWYARGWIDENVAKDLLRRQKYIEAVIPNILKDAYKRLSLSQIEDLWNLGMITEEEIEQRIKEMGYAPEDMALLKELTKFKGVSSEINKLITRICEHYAYGLIDRATAERYIVSLGKGDLATGILLDAYKIDLELRVKRQKIDNLQDAYYKGLISLEQLEEELSKIVVDPGMLEVLLEEAQIRKTPYISPLSYVRYELLLRRLYGMKEAYEKQIAYYQDYLKRREEYWREKEAYIIEKYDERLRSLEEWKEKQLAKLKREYEVRLEVLKYLLSKVIKMKDEEIRKLMENWERELRIAPPMRRMWLRRALDYLKAMLELPRDKWEEYIDEQMDKVEAEYDEETRKVLERYEENKKLILEERDKYLAVIHEQRDKDLALIRHKIEIRQIALSRVQDEIAILERIGVTIAKE